MITKRYSILPPSLIDYNFKRRGTKKENTCQILMGNLKETDNFLEARDIKERTIWNRILREIKWDNSTTLRDRRLPGFLHISIQSQQEILWPPKQLSAAYKRTYTTELVIIRKHLDRMLQIIQHRRLRLYNRWWQLNLLHSPILSPATTIHP